MPEVVALEQQLLSGLVGKCVGEAVAEVLSLGVPIPARAVRA